MATVEMIERGTYRAECERCGWHEDHADTPEAVAAASFHKYGFARRGMFAQERRPELLCVAWDAGSADG